MNSLTIIALTMALGYLLGRIKIKGLSLGTSGILLVALVFGHFGLLAPEVKNIGLACFVTAVGIIAGPTFFENFKKGAFHYIILGIVTICIGALTCVVIIKMTGISSALALGLLNGALTSTPGLAAALEATGDPMASVGYGIAYPFGVLGVVLFVQLLPRLLKTDIRTEMAEMDAMEEAAEGRTIGGIEVEPLGIFPFAVALALGIWLGSIKIPLGTGASFNLGVSGGPLIVGLILGHFRRLGPISLKAKKSTMETLRELGLSWFLLGAGTEAGQGFVEVLKEYGVMLFLFGALMTLLPVIIVFIVAKKVMKLTTMNSLGSICGGMTSTPALGSLIAVAGSDSVATAYAATYPIALVMVVLLSQFIAVI